MRRSHLVICLGLLQITFTCAFPQFVSQFPNGNAGLVGGTGIVCQHLGHEDCAIGAPRNAFGQDWDDNGRVWDKALCEMDSDGDGLTNGEELGDPCCEWTLDNPTELRTEQLSHPGEMAEDGARSAPSCRQTTGGGTTSAPTTTSTTTESTTATTTATTTAPTTTSTTTESTTAATTTTTTTTTTAPTTTAGTTTGSTAATTTATTTTSSAAAGSTTASTTSVTTTAPTTIAPTATPDDDDDGVCFPAHATVQLDTGSVKRMDQLETGDRVHIGAGQYSEVFLFTHKIPDVHHEFVTLRAGTKERVEASITLTKSHFIYANGKLVTAEHVKIGDTLELHDGQVRPVVDVECATFKGLYNPQTTHGDIIVDGVRVSTYTTAVDSRLAHSLLAPLRAVYRWIGWSMQALEKGAPRIVRILS